MGKKDTSGKDLIKRPAEFAAAVNLAAFEGEGIVRAENVSELDPTELVTIYSRINGKKKSESVQRYRDVLKMVTFDNNEKIIVRVIMGSEIQAEVHYGMPVKDMLYDAINYAEQITILTDVNRTKKRTSNPAEFLSGITKEDRLIPVVTIVLFLSADEWDGPTTLHDMLNFEGVPKEVKAMVADYKIHIIEPYSIEDDKLEKIESSLGMVLGAIKNSGSKDDFRDFINRHSERFVSFPNYAAEVIDKFCTMELPEEELEKEAVDMCKAVVELRAEGRAEGLQQGFQQGMQLTMLQVYHNMIADNIPEEQARKLSGVTDEMLENEKKK